MISEKQLIIDIGTNSILALLAVTGGRKIQVLFDERATTRLGENLRRNGTLSQEAMQRTADVIEAFLGKMDYDRAFLIGTEAMRIASNSEVFNDMIFRRTGEKIVIISGAKEAELNFFGALHDLPDGDNGVTVLDIGGGSTEIACGNRAQIESVASIPVGAATLFESSPKDTLETYKTLAEKIVMDESIGMKKVDSSGIVATGGTITSLATMIERQEIYDPGSIHGLTLGVEQIGEAALKFEGLASKERKKLIPLDTQRADLILPGAGIFISILGILGADRVTVSTGGLRFGVATRPDLLET